VDVTLIQVSMPDKNGFVSFGVSADITRALVQNAKNDHRRTQSQHFQDLRRRIQFHGSDRLDDPSILEKLGNTPDNRNPVERKECYHDKTQKKIKKERKVKRQVSRINPNVA
jgi:hypothetical protein